MLFSDIQKNRKIIETCYMFIQSRQYIENFEVLCIALNWLKFFEIIMTLKF